MNSSNSATSIKASADSSLPQNPEETSLLKQWLAILSVAIGAFALVTSEFLPVGVLNEVAQDLGISVDVRSGVDTQAIKAKIADLRAQGHDVELLFSVSEKVFDPPPKVKSAVLKLVRNDRKQLSCNEKLFNPFVSQHVYSLLEKSEQPIDTRT